MFLHLHLAKQLQSNWFLATLPQIYLRPQVTEVQKGDKMSV